MFKSKRVNESNAKYVEDLLQKTIIFSIGEDGNPVEISVAIPLTTNYVIIRPGQFSGQLVADLVTLEKKESSPIGRDEVDFEAPINHSVFDRMPRKQGHIE